MTETFQLADLADDDVALEPHISGTIMEPHHGRHHAGDVTSTNRTVERLAASRRLDA